MQRAQIKDPRDPTGDTVLDQIFAHGAFGCSAFGELPGRIIHQNTTILYLAHYENETYVIKQLVVESTDVDSPIVRKMSLILALDHGNIARYYGLATVLGADKGLIMARTALRFYDGCTASTWSARERSIANPFRHEKIRQILRQLLEGLQYLHSFREDTQIIHCDIKSDNLVLLDNETPVPIIIDFETAAVRVSDQMAINSDAWTCSYAAPQQLRNAMEVYEEVEELSVKTDIWSFGCVAVQLCIGRKPIIRRWNETSGYYENEIEEVFSVVLNVGERLAKPDTDALQAAGGNQLLVDLITPCLSFETDLRPTAGELLLHEYFTNRV